LNQSEERILQIDRSKIGTHWFLF